MNKIKTNKCYAVILASGSGVRYNSDEIPKHLIKINDIPTIVWSLNSVLKSNIFDRVVIVTRDIDQAITRSSISKFFEFDHYKLITAIGGDTRMESFFNGLNEISKSIKIHEDDIISLIDANRPFTSVNQIFELYNLADTKQCSCLARPVVNGVAKTNGDKIIHVPKKEDYVEFVTPEFIKFKILKDVNNKNKFFKSLVEFSLNISVKPSFAKSSDLNSKLTYPEDRMFLEKLSYKCKITL